jgi:SAM-dependent methyltransferase
MQRGSTTPGLGERPFPGEELVSRVAGGPDRDAFFLSGRQSATEIARALQLIGRGFSDYERVLDFGAGCGRILTWLDDMAGPTGPEFHATDIDAEAIAWINEHLPFAKAQTNDAMPPLSYPDGYFDLVYNHSVFTHIDATFQDAWLQELRRVTKPGAHLILTVHGEHAFSMFEDARRRAGQETFRAAFDERGFVFMPDESWQRYFPDWYGGTYHSTSYVFAHWSRWFRILAYLPRGALGFQDMVLLEHRGDDQDPYLRADAHRGEREAAEAIQEVQALLARGTDLVSRSRYGVAGNMWRRALRILLRNYAVYQRDVDDSLVRAMRKLNDRISRLDRPF